MEELKKAPVTVLLILANILVFTAVEFSGGGGGYHAYASVRSGIYSRHYAGRIL